MGSRVGSTSLPHNTKCRVIGLGAKKTSYLKFMKFVKK